jgi:ribosome maturation factor RimP
MEADMPGGPKTAELIASALAPLLASEKIDLEALEITPAGKRRVIRVLVDADGGISLDQVAAVAKEVSAELDRIDESGQLGQTPYVLEVSSPGVDRPLTLPRHWRRNISRLVKVSLADESNLLGRIISADENSAQIDADGVLRTISYEDVKKAHIEIEFNRTGEK